MSGEGIRKKVQGNPMCDKSVKFIVFFLLLYVRNEVDKLRPSFFCAPQVLTTFFPKICNYSNTLAFLIKIQTFTRHTLYKNDREKFNAFIVCCGWIKYIGYIGILLLVKP